MYQHVNSSRSDAGTKHGFAAKNEKKNKTKKQTKHKQDETLWKWSLALFWIDSKHSSGAISFLFRSEMRSDNRKKRLQ